MGELCVMHESFISQLVKLRRSSQIYICIWEVHGMWMIDLIVVAVCCSVLQCVAVCCSADVIAKDAHRDQDITHEC